MANSRGRRRLRRQLQEAGLGHLLETPSQRSPTINASQTSPPFWKRIPAWIYALLGGLAIVVTLLEGYPWLSVEEGPILEPHNPLSEMFQVVNGGYVTVTDLDAHCIVTMESTHHVSFNDSGFNFPGFANYLAHDGRTTIPCFRSIRGLEFLDGSKLDIVITYAMFHANIKFLRKSQTFHFKSVADRQGLLHWQFLS